MAKVFRCKYCKCTFPSMQGQHSHLSQAKKCHKMWEADLDTMHASCNWLSGVVGGWTDVSSGTGHWLGSCVGLLMLYWLIDVSVMAWWSFLVRPWCYTDVMVRSYWVACIPIVGFWLMDWWLAPSCIRVQPQCSSISTTLTSPLNGKLSLLSQFHITSTLPLQRGSSRQTC